MARDTSDHVVAVVETVNGTDLVTGYEYSAVGDLTTIQDARTGRRTFEYDLAGHRTAIVTPETGRVEFGYDAMGNMTEQADTTMCPAIPPLLASCAGHKIKRDLQYGRVLSIDYPETSTSPDITFTYGDSPASGCTSTNAKGRPCKIVDETGTELRSYGALGEVVTQTRSIRSFESTTGTHPFETKFVYDTFGRLLTLAYPDGEILTYAYDAGGRVKQLSSVRNGTSQGYVTSRVYDRYGRAQQTSFGNGLTETDVYDSVTQRLAQRVVSHASLIINKLDITSYDRSGNILASQSTRSDGGFVDHVERSYTYDDIERLQTFAVAGTRNDTTPVYQVNGTYDYSYGGQDHLGNITQQTFTATGTASGLARNWSYSFDPLRPSLATAIGDKTFTYDARGSVKSITAGTSATLLDWTDRGKLRSYKAPDATKSSYRYDSAGARVWRQTDQPSVGGGVIASLILAPNEYYGAELQMQTPAGCSTAACKTTLDISRTKHVRLDGVNIASTIGLIGPTPAASETSIAYAGAAPVYVHCDQVRSTVVASSIDGSAEAVYEYLPFGEPVREQSVVSQPEVYMSFNGMERDRTTALTEFAARPYDATLGRWLTADMSALTKSKATASPRRLNLYAFGISNPVRYFDPTGEAEKETNTWQPALDALAWLACQSLMACIGAKEQMKTFDDVAVLATSAFGEGQHLGGKPLQEWDLWLAGLDLGGKALVSLSALRGAAAVAGSGRAAEGAGAAEKALVDANKLSHIFGKAAHNLGPLVEKFGSQEATFNIVQNATQAAVESGGITGVFETTVSVAGENVVVRGNVVEGVARIGTFFIP